MKRTWAEVRMSFMRAGSKDAQQVRSMKDEEKILDRVLRDDKWRPVRNPVQL